jgi:hypothetical protein
VRTQSFDKQGFVEGERRKNAMEWVHRKKTENTATTHVRFKNNRIDMK